MIDEKKNEGVGVNKRSELEKKLIILIIVMTVDAGRAFQTSSGRLN